MNVPLHVTLAFHVAIYFMTQIAVDISHLFSANTATQDTTHSCLPLMSEQMPDGNLSQENDRPVKLPIRTRDGQEDMDPTQEPSEEKIRLNLGQL